MCGEPSELFMETATQGAEACDEKEKKEPNELTNA